ncbi:MAG: CHAT domain-containing protein, partial [Synechococcales bacterium]|nr:CHAT domain-containing protein [Synechococcales bacterium]
TQNNLAIAYRERIRGDRAENLEQAIGRFRSALEVRTPETLPLDALQTGRNLGNLGFREGLWGLAIEGYTIAIAAVEQSRHWAISNERKQEILEQAIAVYENMIHACIQCDRLDLALQTVERSRSKRLVELMATHDLYADGVPDDIRPILEKLEAIQQKMDQHRRPDSSSPERELTGATRQSRAASQAESELIQQLEAQKQAYLQQLNAKDPVSAGLKEVQVPDLESLRSLVQSPHTALLSFYTTDTDTHIFILKANSLHHFVCTGQGFNSLQSWLIDTWVNPYIAINNARTQEERRQRRQVWMSAMPTTLQELAQRLQLSTLLQQDYMGDIQNLILTPHLFLHQIPFGALPLAENKTLGDVYLIRYAPSCQVLQFCEQRAPVQLDRLGIVENATHDLPFSSYECEQIAQLFAVSADHRLRGRTHATPSNYRTLLSQVQGLVSSHHAQSRIDNPLESALMLADGSRVTLGQLLSPGWRFRNLGDVFLSACETGLSFSVKSTEEGLNIKRTDDIFTIGTGFLCAGARSVISTLWSVDDLATALFSTFYHRYRQAGKNRVTALRRAQNDLRKLSGQELKDRYKEPIQALLDQQWQMADKYRRTARRQQNQPDEQYWVGIQQRLENAIGYLKQQCKCDRPFDHPVYWAGFVVQGMP